MNRIEHILLILGLSFSVAPQSSASNGCPIAKEIVYAPQYKDISVLIQKAMDETPKDDPVYLDLEKENPNLRVFYSSTKNERVNKSFQSPLLNLSWYLVGNSQSELNIVRDYLIATNPERPQSEFDLKPLNDTVYALMIFDEMIPRTSKIQQAVRVFRQEHDSEQEEQFWQASDPSDPAVALLSYYNMGECGYQQSMIECKPEKFLKFQLFAIANRIQTPDLKTYFDGKNRVIEFKGRQIWPMEHAYPEKILTDEKLTTHEDMYKRHPTCNKLKNIDRSLIRIVGPSDEAAKKYDLAYQHIVGPIIMPLSYAEMNFFSLLKKLAIKALESHYESKTTTLLYWEPALKRATSKLLIDNLAQNPDSVRLLAGIIHSAEVRKYLLEQCDSGKAKWAHNLHYPYIPTEDNIENPISDLASTAKMVAQDALSLQTPKLYDVLQQELQLWSEAKGACLSNAILSFQSNELSSPLVQDEQLSSMLSQLSEDQISQTKELVRIFSNIDKLFDEEKTRIDDWKISELKTIEQEFAEFVAER